MVESRTIAYAQADSVLDVLLCMCGGAWGIPHHT